MKPLRRLWRRLRETLRDPREMTSSGTKSSCTSRLLTEDNIRAGMDPERHAVRRSEIRQRRVHQRTMARPARIAAD